jgi:hypothetical protein
MKATKAAFEKYLLSQDQKEKHAFEKQHSDDELIIDAVEGYIENPEGWSHFSGIDKRNSSKRRKFAIPSLIIGLGLVILIGVLWRPQEFEKEPMQKELPKKSLVAKIKIHQPKDLKSLAPLSSQKRISPLVVSNDFVLKRNDQEQQVAPISPMQQLPLKPIQTNNDSKKELKRKIGRELLIKNFKVIDYKYYRKSNFKGREINEASEQNEEISIPYINLLSSALENFAKNDYKLCLLKCDQILAEYPDDANALFYGALSTFNLKQFEQAENRLLKLKTIDFSNFMEEANWYLLLVYQQQKKEAAFSSHRLSIVEDKGFYAERAANLRY